MLARLPLPPFARFLLRRAGALVLLGIGITLVAFLFTQVVPGDPVAANLGDQAAGDPEVVQAFRERYGLDEPVPLQYWTYLSNLVHGDLGVSLQTGEPVRTNLATFIPATAELALLSTLVAVLVGVSFGVAAAVRRNRFTDHALRVVSLAGISMPTFWIALVALYVFFFRLGWFPGGDRLDPGVLSPPHTTGMFTVDALLAGQWSVAWNALHHLILPALVLAAYNVDATLAQRVQANLRDIGLNVTLSGAPVGTWLDKYRNGTMAFGLSLWGPDYPDPADYLAFVPGELVGVRVGWQRGADPTLERLAARARRTTSDRRRAPLYQQIQRRLNASGPYFPLIQPTQTFAATRDLANAVFNPLYSVNVREVRPAS